MLYLNNWKKNFQDEYYFKEKNVVLSTTHSNVSTRKLKIFEVKIFLPGIKFFVFFKDM